MAALVDKLNEILADEWACVRVLRRAEPKCDDPGRLEMIKRVRKDCSVNCVNLTNVIRSLGGRPTDVPSPRFSIQLAGESLAEILDLAQSVQKHVVDEITALIDDSQLQSSRTALATIQQLHKEDIRWLATVLAP
jgi:bacterioferritin (cytochrome b1)